MQPWRRMLQRMSLSARLTVAFSTTAVLLLGGASLWQLSVEEREQRATTARELRLLGRSLQVAFENALRDRQSEDVEETLHALERIDPSVDIFVYDAEGSPMAASSGASPDRRPWELRGEEGLVFREDASPPVVELRLPLRITERGAEATLLIVQDLAAMQASLSAARERAAAATFGLFAVVVVVAVLVTRYWVSQPLERMIDQMRRVRAGDLSPSRTSHRRHDEIGATLDEFDALVSDLAVARDRLQVEEEARRRLELGLREVDKLATVGQLAAGVAHEIGSPLQVLEGRIASLEAKASDANETRRLARILHEQTRRITRIVSRLTDLARRPTYARGPLDPEPPVRTVVDLLGLEARRRQVHLGLRVSGPLPPVLADSDAIQQVTLNLVRNALQSTSEGGRVEVTLEPATMRRSGTVAVRAVRLTVTDDGVGMDESQLARAFEPFFTTRAPEGTGLGLAVVRGLVDDQQGEVRLASREGRGTTCTVELPCEDAVRAPGGEADAAG